LRLLIFSGALTAKARQQTLVTVIAQRSAASAVSLPDPLNDAPGRSLRQQVSLNFRTIQIGAATLPRGR
jgi:hypothetical protein